MEKTNFFAKITSFFAIILMFAIWLMDRSLHIILPHREHPQFTVWAKEPTSVKQAFARLLIFSTPIIIFNLFL